MSWRPDRRVERIASYAVKLANNSLAERFRRAVERVHPQTTACDDPPGSARHIEDLGVRVIRQAAEQTTHNLQSVAIERHGAFAPHETNWVLQMTNESLDRLRAVIQEWVDARFDASSWDGDRIAREHSHAMEACAYRPAVAGPPINTDHSAASGFRSRT